jgi:hypothetical protein
MNPHGSSSSDEEGTHRVEDSSSGLPILLATRLSYIRIVFHNESLANVNEEKIELS